MEDQKELVVDGYRFDRLSDAGEAALEIEKATYFEQRISGRSPENMLAIYDKVLDERIFVTPVGWEYLKFLQARLKEEGIDADRIRPIPLYHTFHFQKVDEQENKGVARERIHPSTKKKMTTADKMRISVIMNVILVLLVAVLFIITLNGENANCQELVNVMNKINSDMDIFESIKLSQEYTNLWNNIITNTEWKEVTNATIAQPVDAENGTQYVVLLKKELNGTTTYDAQVLTSKKETSEDEVKEVVKTETRSELPVTFDNPILFVLLGVAVVAIVVIAIRIRSLSKKNEK